MYEANMIIGLIIVCVLVLKWEIYCSNKEIQKIKDDFHVYNKAVNAVLGTINNRIKVLENNQEKKDIVYQD